MIESKAMICGCSGTCLTADETAFFAAERPWGLILFARNIGTADDIRALTAEFRAIVGRADAPVFIDQEGGRVQRIRAPLVPDYPSAAQIGALYARNRDQGLSAARLLGALHAADLSAFGINADCLPVLDVPVAGAADVIGNRAYGHSPEQVSVLGRAVAEGLMAGGVLPVIKHVPGHGRALLDSHEALPVVDTDAETLEATDFVPFRALCDLPMAMTAHVVYTAFDGDNPATTSRQVISNVIRGQIGFDGLLMTDDLSMHALSGDFAARARASLSAGCDVVLHCNGVMDQMAQVAAAVPLLSGKARLRADGALTAIADPPEAVDKGALRAQFTTLMAA